MRFFGLEGQLGRVRHGDVVGVDLPVAQRDQAPGHGQLGGYAQQACRVGRPGHLSVKAQILGPGQRFGQLVFVGGTVAIFVAFPDRLGLQAVEQRRQMDQVELLHSLLAAGGTG